MDGKHRFHKNARTFLGRDEEVRVDGVNGLAESWLIVNGFIGFLLIGY